MYELFLKYRVTHLHLISPQYSKWPEILVKSISNATKYIICQIEYLNSGHWKMEK